MQNRKDTVLWVVIPCYNEEEVLPITMPLFKAQMQAMMEAGKISDKSRLVFVNDGSRDRTWEIIRTAAAEDPMVLGIAQSRNRGHQSTVLAGLMEAKEHADVAISVDCDGQDDLSAMADMMDAYHDGCEVVYGVRSNRKKDTFLKRFTAQSFYKLLRWMGAEVVYNHADYRLMSRRVLEELSHFEEVNIYLRGMVPLVGFKSTSVYYERQERMEGKSHYSIGKMFGLAFDGITSLSVKPLHLITGLGFLVAIISFIGVIWAVVEALMGHTVAGWSSTTCIICFVSGVQLICMGIIGEYIGKIYLESKHRPRYIIEETTYEKDIKNL